MRVDILVEADLGSIQVVGFVWQIEVAASGDVVSEHFAPVELQFGQHTVLEALIEDVVRVPLDGQIRLFQEVVRSNRET